MLKQELDNVVKALSVRIEDLLTCSNLIGKICLQDPVNPKMIDETELIRKVKGEEIKSIP